MRYPSATGRPLLLHSGFIFSIRDYHSFTLIVFVICGDGLDAAAVISGIHTLVGMSIVCVVDVTLNVARDHKTMKLGC